MADEATEQKVRPAVLSVAYKEKAALYAAYVPVIARGGLFVPTDRPGRLGDGIYLMVSLPEDTTRHAVTGKVVWITPPDVPGRPQGLGVQFADDVASMQLRQSIENLLGSAVKSARPTHTV